MMSIIGGLLHPCLRMNLLHQTRQLATGLLGQMMLAWLVLSVGAASAAPILHPQSLEIVCPSAGEVRLVSKTDDGHPSSNASHRECAMCLPFSAPPAASQPPNVRDWFP